MKKGFTFLLACTIVFIYSCKNAKNESQKAESNLVVKSEKEDGMEQWMEQQRMMKMDPKLGYVPYERLEIAKQYAFNLIKSRVYRTTALTWEERGPNNVGGRTRALLVDKNDATGNTIFAGSVGGGIWKCTNFKSLNFVWTPIQVFSMTNLAVTTLAQDPSNPNVMYAGTGEGWFNLDAIRGGGIWKSTDGGNTWSVLTSTQLTFNNYDYIQKIVVTSTGLVFASCRGYYCNNGGTFKSSDGGTTWTRVIGTYDNSGNCTTGAVDLRGSDLEIAANGDLYATTGISSDGTNSRGKIFRSLASNGANIGNVGTWVEVTPPATAASTNWRRIEIATAPNNSNVIYALCQKSASNGIGAIFKSSDGGSTWVQQTSPSWCNQGSNSSDFTNGQAWYDLIVAVDPNNASKCFIGGVDMLKTVDGGASWSQATQWSSGCSSLPNIHADQHNIQFINGSSNDIIASNDGGVYYSADAGVTWSAKNTGYNVTQFYAVDIHPTSTNFFLAGAQDNGSHRFSSTGVASTTRVTGGDGGFCHIDQTDGNIQLTSYVYNNYYYSRNGGSNFATVAGGNSSTSAGYFINPTEYDDEADVLYTSASADSYGLVTGLNGTGTPSYSTVALSGFFGARITALKVDPNVTSGGTVWFAGYIGSASPPILMKISNANTGSAPTVLKSGAPSSFSNGTYVSSIDVENGNPNHILVTSSSYGVNNVMESTDGGTTWTKIDGNLPDMPINWGVIAPSDALLTSSTTGGGIILATDAGVWCTSTSNGNSTVWVPQSNNLGSVSTQMLKYRASDRTLLAATHGRGLFTTVLPSTTTGVNPVVNTKGFINYISANNNNLFVNTGNLTGITNITINIIDMQGKTVKSAKVNYSNQNIPINNLPKGGYIVKIYGSKKEQFVQQFVK